MSFTEKRLCNPTQLTTSGQTLYTVPASKTAIIKQIVVTNVTGSAVTFSLYIGSASTANALFSGTSVAANDTVIINLSQVLSQNEILTSLASANSSLNITISGVENDGPLNPLSTYIADGAITSAKIAAGAVIEADIANNAVTQAKLASSLSGATIVTSSTRSSLIPSPFTGQLCYETDTGYLRVWDGSAWDYLSQKQDTAEGLPAETYMGLVKVIPTGATNGTVGATGSVTVGNAVSSVSVTCFSTAYDHYRVLYLGGTNSVTIADLRFQLDGITTGYYGGVFGVVWNTSGFGGKGINNQASFIYAGNAESANFPTMILDVYNPYVAKAKRMISDYYYSNTNEMFGRGVCTNQSTALAASFTITPSSGTLTGGTIRVYGYRN